MELVEGEDLEQRIARGPIPLDRAVEIATQIATALEIAHGQGIVHRDLKPANVKLTADGDVKVLDFGLAKALANESASGDAMSAPSLSPTLTSAGTLAGMIIGTPAYMSPEQARARPADKRADLWALGCVLFEMLTAQRCFGGETISDTLASVLKEEPDWSQLPGDTPPAIRRLLRRSLAKDARKRLSDAADARLELTEAFEPFETVVAVAPAPVSEDVEPPGKLPWILAAVASLVAVMALAAWWTGGELTRSGASEAVHLSVALPPEFALNDDQESLLEVSPDGRYLVFGAFDPESSTPSLFLRDFSEATVVPLPETSGARNPFFSPDSRWVAFFADNQLKKIQVGGSASIAICDVTGNTRGASWGEDDRIVLTRHFAGGLDQVAASGGTATALTELDAERKERTHRWPQIVPRHGIVLFTVATTDSPEFYDDARIDAVRLSTGERKTVFEGASFARYVPTGHLVFGRGGFLYAVPFDIDRLEVEGTPTPVLEGVAGAANSGAVYASVSQNGLLAYVPGKPESPRRRLKWLYVDGREELLDWVEPGGYIDPEVSPNGKFVAVAAVGDRSRDIWVLDLQRESRLRVTFTGENSAPIWTPDGKSLLFTSVRDGREAVYITAADGTGGERVFYVAGPSVNASDVSRDGVVLLVASSDNEKTDVVTKPLNDTDAEATPLLIGPAAEQRARFSPDGRWIAYSSDESGDYEVFVQPHPGPGGRWQVSTRGGVDPRWSPDGKQIHFRVNRDWWVADVSSGDGAAQTFRVGTPRLVRNDLPRAQLAFTEGMSVEGDARLVAVSDDNRGTADEIRVVVHWLEELERLVGPS